MLDVVTKNITIPKELIYEMDEGHPIYYKGYKSVLNQTKTKDQIMGSSVLQSILIELIKDFLKEKLGKNYVVLSNELGLQFKKKSWRAADIAVFEKKALLKAGIDNKYSAIPPKYVIEIDTKADFENITSPQDYFNRKTDQLLDFGVEKVLWIFSSSEKFLLATPQQKWEIGNWNDDVILENELIFNVKKMLEDFQEN